MLTIAVKAARRAGSIINQASRNLDILTVSRKSHSDFVSEVDGAAEEAIIKVLMDAYPTHSILAEESGNRGDAKKIRIPMDHRSAGWYDQFSAWFPQICGIDCLIASRGVIPSGRVRSSQQ